MTLHLNLYLLLFSLFLFLLNQATAQTFSDVSKFAGIDHSMGPRKKYGGPTIADLNLDGHPDLLFVHHDKYPCELYINNGNGTFRKNTWQYFTDSHAITPFRHSAFSKNMRFVISQGGSMGTMPAPPLMWEYQHADGTVIGVTESSGTSVMGGRGRSAVFLPLNGGQDFRPDVIFTNSVVIPGFEPQQFGYKNIGRGKFALRRLRGFADTTNEFIMPIDIDNDGTMEIVAYQEMKIYKMTSPFKFKDITASVVPNYDYRGTVSIAEIDYDNDGDMDLYISRTNTGSMKWLAGYGFRPDFFFENRNGVFVDVTAASGIPQDSDTRGVTVGDFNNDGYMDLYITGYKKPDLLLTNTGKKTFTPKSGLIPRPGSVNGDSAHAVDYDSDGRIDLVVGQGDRDLVEFGGVYRIFKNQLNLTPQRRYILVHVGSAPDKLATSMHALVTVTGAAGFKVIRRVGSPGTTVSNSYIDIVHVGLGWRVLVDVKVVWTNGRTQTKTGQLAGTKILMGVV